MSENLFLSAGDQVALVSFNNKLYVIRDLVTAVARGFKNGLFLYGNGGNGKSFTVLTRLKELGASYQLHNSRMTGKGLFMTLKDAPDVCHVIEDVERLTKDADAQGVLRSAMWAQPGQQRVVTWTTAKEGRESCAFRGGIILISNRPLADLPELRALATRIEVLRLDVTDAELAARMRDLASQGYRIGDQLVIEPEECIEVTEELLNECAAAGCPLDLRLQQKCFETYRQWDVDQTALHWKDLMVASVREAAQHLRHESNTMSLQARIAQRRDILRGILSETDNAQRQEELYKEKTGKSRADLFRRKAELESEKSRSAVVHDR